MISRSSPWFRVICALGGILFATAAALQINDIDPAVYDRPSSWDAWGWTLFYLLIAGLFFFSIVRMPSRLWLGLAAALCAVQMARTIPGVYQNLFQADHFTMTGTSMSPARSEVELSREFFGALISLGSVSLLWWQTRRAERAPS